VKTFTCKIEDELKEDYQEAMAELGVMQSEIFREALLYYHQKNPRGTAAFKDGEWDGTPFPEDDSEDGSEADSDGRKDDAVDDTVEQDGPSSSENDGDDGFDPNQEMEDFWDSLGPDNDQDEPDRKADGGSINSEDVESEEEFQEWIESQEDSETDEEDGQDAGLPGSDDIYDPCEEDL